MTNPQGRGVPQQVMTNPQVRGVPQQVLTNSFVVSKLPDNQGVSKGEPPIETLTSHDMRSLQSANDMRLLKPANDMRSLKKGIIMDANRPDQPEASDLVDRDITGRDGPLQSGEQLASNRAGRDSPVTRIKKVTLRLGRNPSESLEGEKVTGAKTISNKDKGRHTLQVNKSLQHDTSRKPRTYMTQSLTRLSQTLM
ncbi:hypothetical protein C8R48DRAFT_676757 [Suillus tomentosus]|nr:hypothetical protein C8R48DRAFT_676757 [Suillus tomentosus]